MNLRIGRAARQVVVFDWDLKTNTKDNDYGFWMCFETIKGLLTLVFSLCVVKSTCSVVCVGITMTHNVYCPSLTEHANNDCFYMDNISEWDHPDQRFQLLFYRSFGHYMKWSEKIMIINFLTWVEQFGLLWGIKSVTNTTEEEEVYSKCTGNTEFI